jgi:glycosyltransferase involved in cell wall biosynthesis
MAGQPRVLHVLRGDHEGHVGGDLVQLSKTVALLREAGVDAVAATVDDGPDHVDVVHLYNLQRPLALRRDRRAAARRWPAASVVLSPVWWPMQLSRMARSGDAAVAAKGVKTAVKTALSWPTLRRALSVVDAVLPNSQTEVDALQRAFRLPASDRWAVVPNGVDLTEWSFERASSEHRAATLARWELAPDTSTIVACVARIEPVKNQATLVRALDHLPDAALVLVGPAGHTKYNELVVREAARGDRLGRVAFAGPMAADEIAGLLRSVDVHVLASFRETPGLATLEAAAVGCEVVVTADGSAPEYLGDEAHVADPFDPASVARAIHAARSTSRQPALRARATGHSWEVAVDALLEAYRRLPAWRATSS